MTNIELLLEKSKKGDLKSLSYLSMVCYEGIEVEKDYSKCLKFATKAIEGGYSEAQFYLGRLYYEGDIVDQDYSRAFKLFEKSAKQINTKAIYWLGRCYFFGKGIKQDPLQGFLLFYSSFEYGNSDAQLAIENCFNENTGSVYQKTVDIIKKRSNELKEAKYQNLLGVLYEHGNGVTEDHSIAFELYHLSKKQRDPFGIKNYGLCYYRNIGVAKNPPRAFKLFEKSAQLGNHRALNSTGYCLQNGIGVEKDLDRSIKLFRKCLQLGNLVGINSLALAYQNGWGVEEDLDKCRELYLKAAYSKYRMSEFNIGFLFHWGIGCDANRKQAIKWYKQSHKHSFLSATNSLGYCYQEGVGVEKNKEKAFNYFLIASKGENKYGECNVGLCYLYGSGVEKNSRLAYKYLRRAINHGHVDAINIFSNYDQFEFILCNDTDVENVKLLGMDPEFEINKVTKNGDSILIHFNSTNYKKNKEEIAIIQILINSGLDLRIRNSQNKLTLNCISNRLSRFTKKMGTLAMDFDRLFDDRINPDYNLGKGMSVHKVWVEKRTKKACHQVANVFKQFYNDKGGLKKCNDFLRWVYSGVIYNKKGIIQICKKLDIDFFNHTTIRQDLIDLWNDNGKIKIKENMNKNEDENKNRNEDENENGNDNGNENENENENDNDNDNENENENENTNKHFNFDFEILIKMDNTKDSKNLQSICVHKFFLLAISGLYRNFFQTVNSKLSKVTDYSSKSFETLNCLFEFLYTGELNFTAGYDADLIKDELLDVIEYYQLNPDLPLLELII
ncbi:sel-1-like protein [Anaeramoeba flamelloides]|uniref:Sel-1-like protein n=1 Tax=Anaeramoeba flamelloides TaxID=1746091 RepID=A0ABQ8YVK5_9EUKA|nr:sel-1-like protein [Anaeramoeba flamelloides]